MTAPSISPAAFPSDPAAAAEAHDDAASAPPSSSSTARNITTTAPAYRSPEVAGRKIPRMNGATAVAGPSLSSSPEKKDAVITTTILSPIPTRPDRASAPSFRLLSPPTPPHMNPSSTSNGRALSATGASSERGTASGSNSSSGTRSGVGAIGGVPILDIGGQTTRKLRRRGRSLRKTALLKPPLHSPVPLLLPSKASNSEYYSDSSSTSPPLKGQSTSGSPAPSVDYAGYGYLPPPPGDSASETVFYGWIVLFSVWAVFVVGMGSVFGAWDWAWDVNMEATNSTTGQCSSWVREITTVSGWETPVPTDPDEELPIEGYYPALIVLTAVMAWVWVVVAWVGLKYFKHAKIQAPRVPDDG